MEPDNIGDLFNNWNLKGFCIGLAVGVVSEVFLMRNTSGKVNWLMTSLSVFAMGLMGWLTYDVAICAFPSPSSAWKATAWSAGITINTWWVCKVVSSGQMFQLLLRSVLPNSMNRNRRYEDEN